MATTTRVSCGEPSRSRLLGICACFRLEHCAAQRRCGRGTSRHLIIGTRCRDRTATLGGPTVWSIGLVPGGGPRDLTIWATAGGTPPVRARPSNHWIKRCFGASPRGSGATRWVRPLGGKPSPSQIGAIGASLVAAQQSAPVQPAPAPVGSTYFDARRQGICNL